MNWANKNKGIVLFIFLSVFFLPLLLGAQDQIDLSRFQTPGLEERVGDQRINFGTGDNTQSATRPRTQVNNVNANPTTLNALQGVHATDLPGLLQQCGEGNCGWKEIFLIADALGQLAMVFTTIVATVLFVYAGFLYISAQGDTGKIQKATGIFKAVIIGFVIILVSYVLISELLEKVAVQGLSNIIQ